jgi:hypothetical protein
VSAWRGLLLSVLLATGAAAPVKAATPAFTNTEQYWAEYLNAEVRPTLASAIVKLSPAERARVSGLDVQIIRRGQVRHTDCDRPATLAASRRNDSGAPVILLCANNLPHLDFLYRQYAYVSIISRQYASDQSFLDYLSEETSLLQRNRQDMQVPGRYISFGCAYPYFLYQKGLHPGAACAIPAATAPPDPGYAAFLAKPEFYDRSRFALARTGLELAPSVSDRGVVDALSEEANDNLRLLMKFAALHELAHVFHGDLTVTDNACVILAQEKAADAFAATMVVRLDILDSESAVPLLQFPWLVISSVVGSQSNNSPTYEALVDKRGMLSLKQIAEALKSAPRGTVDPAAFSALQRHIAAHLPYGIGCPTASARRK